MKSAEQILAEAQGLPDPMALVVDELTRRVAQVSLEAAEWRSRAISAEAAMGALRQALDEDAAEVEDAEESQED